MFFAPVVRTRATAPLRSYDRSFERFVNDAFFASQNPGLQVEQDEKGWTLSLDMPGVTREALSISIDGPVVRIETKADARRPYKAAYELSQEIDAEQSGARLENGVLTLTLARKAPVVTARQIEIK